MTKKRWPFGTPPTWLRHIAPWWLLYWLNDYYDDLCWAGVVTWKVYGGGWTVVSSSCFAHTQGPVDYCGKWPSEKAREFGDSRPIPVESALKETP